MISFFKDAKIEQEFQEFGFVRFANIGNNNVHEILELNKKLNIPDDMGKNFNVGLNCNNLEKRIHMREALVNILEDFFKEITNNRFIHSATLMDKISHQYSIVPAHQDWTYTDEDKYDSVMCWIPLVDVNYKNGALGFVPKSNHFFNYIRYFPFPNNHTPVDKYNLFLMTYFDVIEMKAGDIIFFNNKTIHGSFPNLENKTRHAVALSFGINDQPLFAYLKKPNSLNVVSKYLVDKDFSHKYNNTYIANCVKNNIAYNFDYPLLDELEISFPEINLAEIKNLLNKNNIQQNENYEKYITSNYGDLLSLNETSIIKQPKINLLTRLKKKFLK